MGKLPRITLLKQSGICHPNCLLFYERSELRAKRVTSINQLGVRGIFFEFRTPESESERNLTNYFIIFLLLFKIFFMISDI